MDKSLILLVGFMGCGKSSVGKAFATQRGWPFFDLDELIVQQEGRPISEIFKVEGEDYFRNIEHQVLKDLLLAENSGIIALGGGAFTFARNREVVAQRGISIWLDCSMEVITARIGADHSRPLFKNPEQAAALYQARRSAYQQADLSLNISTMSINEVIVALENLLSNH